MVMKKNTWGRAWKSTWVIVFMVAILASKATPSYSQPSKTPRPLVSQHSQKSKPPLIRIINPLRQAMGTVQRGAGGLGRQVQHTATQLRQQTQRSFLRFNMSMFMI